MIVVTAATGSIGRQVLSRLVDSDQSVRVIVRDPLRIPGTLRDRIEVVVGSHRDPGTLDRALADSEAVFWLVPLDRTAPDVQAGFLDFTRPACAAFLRHGIQRVVGVSALGRGFAGPSGLAAASLAMDDLIASTGVNYRALAMPAFMENMLMHADSIRATSSFYSPIVAGLKLPTVATCDIAAAATQLLIDSGWTGIDSVPLLGPEDLSFDEIAGIMSEVLDRTIRYRQISGTEFRTAMLGLGMSEAMARGMLDMLMAKNNGLDQVQPRTPESTTPTSFRTWCQEVFKPALLAAPGRPQRHAS